MARRKKENGIEILLACPWWISAGLALFGWLFLSTIVPALLAGNPVFSAVIALSRSLAWLPLPFFGVIALIAFSRANTNSLPKIRTSIEPSQSRPHQFAWPDASSERDMYAETISSPKEDLPIPAAWTLEALRSLEWKRFEQLCAKYYEVTGFRSVTLAAGPDGGVDIKLYKINPDTPIAIVQCKAWASQVGVKEIRELLGVMHHQKVSRGIFITSSSYSKDALAFGAASPIQLLDGEALLRKILDLPSATHASLKDFAFAGDYRTPTCASCGVKLVKRDGKTGAFWGCINYPRCRTTMKMRATAP